MQYTYSESCSLKRTVGTETERLRTQLISVLYKNVGSSTSDTTILNTCSTWANYIRGLRGSGISYDNDRKIHFASQNCFNNDDSQSIDVTFICKRISGSTTEWLQFAMLNVNSGNFATAFSDKLNAMTGLTDAIDKYIIVNAIIDM